MQFLKSFFLVLLFCTILAAEPITFSMFSNNANFSVDGIDFEQQDLRMDFTVDTNDIVFFSELDPFVGQTTGEGFRYSNLTITYSSVAAGIDSQGQGGVNLTVLQKTIFGGVETQRNSMSMRDLNDRFFQVNFTENNLTSYDGISNFFDSSGNDSIAFSGSVFSDNLLTGESIEIGGFAPSSLQAALQNAVPEPSIYFLLSLIGLIGLLRYRAFFVA